MTYLTGGRPSTLAECEAALARVRKVRDESQGKFGLWGAFSKTDREFVGWVLFRPDKKDPSNTDCIEVGYRLKRKWWGQGVATELSRAMLDYGFGELGVSEIFAITLLGNVGSQAVMKKLGMEFVCEYLETEFPLEDKRAVRYRIRRPELNSN